MADLVIKGLGIPKERSLWLCIKTDGTVYNIKPGGIGMARAVGTAVQLPEGHGRLIDADACHSPEDLNNEPTIVPAEGGTDDGT